MNALGAATPRFSIITRCRNAESLIAPSGLSLRQQTWRDYEWLVIDGASTDGTLGAVAKLGIAHCRVISNRTPASMTR